MTADHYELIATLLALPTSASLALTVVALRITL